jgi:hypothetical protein
MPKNSSRKYRKNIDKHTEGQNKILTTRTFIEGKKVLLKVKDFKLNKTGMDRFQDCCKA